MTNKCDQCDMDHPVRKGRADYHCRKCGTDITLALVLLHEIGLFPRKTKKKKVKNGSR